MVQKNIVIGFGITTKNIKSLKKADGLVIAQNCVKQYQKVEKRQNPVTNSSIVKELKRKYLELDIKFIKPKIKSLFKKRSLKNEETL